jgi:hypothetical protein
MVKSMFEKHVPSDTVIEADFIDDKAPAGVSISETAARAASALESLADAVSAVSPDKAEQMHVRAAAIRAAGTSVEAVIDNGKALLDQGKKAGASVKQLLAKVGIEPEVIKRPRGRHRGAS